jgi:hypothetical protein
MKKGMQLFSTFLAAGMLSISAYAASADVLFVGSAINEADRNRLVFFSSDNTRQTKLMQIKGLQPAERIFCLDVRPANGQLYGVTTAHTLYTFDLSGKVAVANPVGVLSQPLVGDYFGCGFNPNADRLRIVSDANINYSVNPNDAVVTIQTSLAYVAGDANVGQDPGASCADYTNNDNDPATGTTLYDIDGTRDTLVKQDPPASGQLTTIGTGLGVNTIGSLVATCDILTISTDNNVMYAAVQTPDDDRSKLHSVDLTTGVATFIGEIGGPEPLMALAILGSM